MLIAWVTCFALTCGGCFALGWEARGRRDDARLRQIRGVIRVLLGCMRELREQLSAAHQATTEAPPARRPRAGAGDR